MISGPVTAWLSEISLIGLPARIKGSLQAWQAIAKDGRLGSPVLAGAAAAMRVVAKATL